MTGRAVEFLFCVVADPELQKYAHPPPAQTDKAETACPEYGEQRRHSRNNHNKAMAMSITGFSVPPGGINMRVERECRDAGWGGSPCIREIGREGSCYASSLS